MMIAQVCGLEAGEFIQVNIKSQNVSFREGSEVNKYCYPPFIDNNDYIFAGWCTDAECT